MNYFLNFFSKFEHFWPKTAAAYEFSETEEFIKTGEELLGPYVWGNYDLLVLPPSFPYGGMENPCLTFVTPTLLGFVNNVIKNYQTSSFASW